MKNNFELLLVKSLRAYFDVSKTKAVVERRPQQRYIKQNCDIIIDSPRFHIGIECKSIGGDHLYFSRNFHEDNNGKHQIETLDYYFINSGRDAYLAVELRSRRGNVCCFIPWLIVMARYVAGERGFTDEEIRAYSPLTKFKKTKLYNVRPLFAAAN